MQHPAASGREKLPAPDGARRPARTRRRVAGEDPAPRRPALAWPCRDRRRGHEPRRAHADRAPRSARRADGHHARDRLRCACRWLRSGARQRRHPIARRPPRLRGGARRLDRGARCRHAPAASTGSTSPAMAAASRAPSQPRSRDGSRRSRRRAISDASMRNATPRLSPSCVPRAAKAERSAARWRR